MELQIKSQIQNHNKYNFYTKMILHYYIIKKNESLMQENLFMRGWK